MIRGPPSEPSFHSTLITQRVAQALSVTGSFPSTQQSSEFVKAKASKGIETINRLALRLKSAFMVDIVHSDVWLLFEGPRTVFDGMRMAKEFETDEASTHWRQDKVAGTTEVGVEKSVCGLQGEGRRTEVLLKTKVVLEGPCRLVEMRKVIHFRCRHDVGPSTRGWEQIMLKFGGMKEP